MAANAFAVPPPLVAARKKQRTDDGAVLVSGKEGSLCYFSARDYARFSQFGDEAEARRFQLDQQQRRTILMADVKAPAQDDASKRLGHTAALKAKHTLHVLEEFMLKRAPSGSNKHGLELFANGRRRLSAIPISDHEEYLSLVRKKNDALQRGLPEILALTSEEVGRLRELQVRVTEEQTTFFKLYQSVMGPVSAENQAIVPLFASSWFDDSAAREANEAQRLYPQYFEPAISIPLLNTGSEGNISDQAIKHVSEVFRTGSAVTIEKSKLVAGMPIGEMTKCDERARWNSLETSHDPMSVDPHAESLMLKHNCEVSISSSTLLELFDLSTSSPVLGAPEWRWTIPAKIRVIVGSNGSPKKLVYLDRVLRGRNISSRDKVALAGFSLLPGILKPSSEAQGKGQITYHVWIIGGKRVLVRSTTRACLLEEGLDSSTSVRKDRLSENHERLPANDKRPVALSLFVKPDYRDLGLKEQLTASERCKFWLHSWLRGNSRVIVARVAPKQNFVHEWEHYSLQSLIYGRDVPGEAQFAEYFNPMKKFELIANLLGNMCDMTPGTYLVQPNLVDKREPRLEVMASSTDQSPIGSEETESRFNLKGFLQPSGCSNEDRKDQARMTVLPEWYRYDRIPYTFRTGIYCRSFLQDGTCPAVGSGEYCEGRHIRLAPVKEASQWRFEDFTTVIRRGKHANQRTRPAGRPTILTPSFQLCPGKLLSAVAVENLHTPVKCPKWKSGECHLRHFSPHDIAERVADEAERKERTKRRNWKSGANSKQMHGPSASVGEVS